MSRKRPARANFAHFSLLRQKLSLLTKSQRTTTHHNVIPPPVVVENTTGSQYRPLKVFKAARGRKGPETKVPPAGFLRPGIRRHKRPAGRESRWQRQGLSRRGNVLRPPLAERTPRDVRRPPLGPRRVNTWGRGLHLRLQRPPHPAGLDTCFPAPQSQHLSCKPETHCDRGRIRQRKVLSRTFHRCLYPRDTEQRDLGRGGRTWAQPSPPDPGKPGVLALRCFPPEVAGAPGGGPAQVRSSPRLTWNSRPAPARGLGVPRRCHRLCPLYRGPGGCCAAVSFLLTSGSASRGRSRRIYIKGEPAVSAEPRAPGPAPPLSPAPIGRGRTWGAGAALKPIRGSGGQGRDLRPA